jgi:AbrB family looped-hinge helix DNA binding protein
MSKVTSKLQLTIPKRIADGYGIRPGSELVFEAAGEAIRLRVAGDTDGSRKAAADAAALAIRLDLFDATSAWQDQRNAQLLADLGRSQAAGGRGWTREELYSRGVPR